MKFSLNKLHVYSGCKRNQRDTSWKTVENLQSQKESSSGNCEFLYQISCQLIKVMLIFWYDKTLNCWIYPMVIRNVCTIHGYPSTIPLQPTEPTEWRKHINYLGLIKYCWSNLSWISWSKLYHSVYSHLHVLGWICKAVCELASVAPKLWEVTSMNIKLWFTRWYSCGIILESATSGTCCHFSAVSLRRGNGALELSRMVVFISFSFSSWCAFAY